MLIGAATLWSLTGPAVKLIDELPALGFSFWRSVGAGLAAGMFVLIRRGVSKKSPAAAPPPAPPAGPMTVAGLLYIANVTLLIYAMRAGTAASGILLQYTGPVWVAVIGWALLRRRIVPRTLVALALATLGVGVMLAGTSGTLAGSLYGIGSGLSYGSLILALDWLDRTNAHRGRGNTTDPALVVFWLNLAVIVVLLPLAAAQGALGLSLGWPTVAFMIGFGVVQLAIPYALFQMALPRVGPVDASLIVLLEPVLNPLWTFLAVGERPDTATFAGGALLLAALAVEATKRKS